ncbi:MAG: LPS export ABC transporter permease LptF [Acidiferrobacteraceae bacterium]
MILDRAFYREARQTTVAVTVIFLSLYLVISLVNLLARAANGDFPAHVVLLLLALETLKNVNLILPLAMFIGVLMTIGRWYRDSEMTVLAACGISPLHFVRPALVFAFWTALVVAMVTFYLVPMSDLLINKVQTQNESVYQYGVVAGQFNRSKGGHSIFYVERNGHGTRLHGIFASSEQFGKAGVLIAKSGYEYTDSKTGTQYLVLRNGMRYQGIPGQANYKILHYHTYALHIKPPRPAPARVVAIDEVPTSALFSKHTRPYEAEWQWRLAKPLSLFILAPLAIALAYTDVRQGRFANLFIAVLIYFAYANMIMIANAMIVNNALSAQVGLWWVHALFAALTVYLLWRRTGNRPVIPGRFGGFGAL